MSDVTVSYDAAAFPETMEREVHNSAMKAYQSVVGSAQNGRQADIICFKMLVDLLKDAEESNDPAVKRAALEKHQRLWSMIMKANALDTGVTPEADRELFASLAHQCQRYGIRVILDTSLSIKPLIDVAENIILGLEREDEGNVNNNYSNNDDLNLMF